VRTTLVTALSDCVAYRKRRSARRFLQGLSTDELQYIAEFVGCCILERPGRKACSRREVAEGITHFESSRPACAPPDRIDDQEHKMILLLEYLCRSGLAQYSLALRARQSG